SYGIGVGVASAAMLLAALNCPGLHPGYNTNRPRLLSGCSATQPFAGPKYLSRARKNLEISSMSRSTVLSAGGIFRVNDSCQFADKQL
ncbi:hypothetical protein ACMFY5_19315, partial [Pseudomonas sihuiensis]